MTSSLPSIPILFEDQDLVVVNKPAGLVVNRSDTALVTTLQDWFHQFWTEEILTGDNWSDLVPADFKPTYGLPAAIFQQRAGLVHRLDKDTSGVIVLAKNPGSLVNLLAQFEQRQVAKKYLCLVHGQVSAQLATSINLPLARSKFDRQRFSVQSQGRSAVTDYQVLKYFSNWQIPPELNADNLGNFPELAQLTPVLRKKLERYHRGFSLLECQIRTGRTHQIRVHLSHLGYPLVGDQLYGSRKKIKFDQYWCPRHFLHAAWLRFVHPRTQRVMEIVAPLPTQLTQALSFLS